MTYAEIVASTGWYPDPGGVGGRFRYWDGNAWSSQTTGDPAHTPAPKKPDDARPKRGPERGWLVALVVLAVVTAIVIALLFFMTGGLPGSQNRATEDTNSSTPTVSAWDETSTPTYTPPPLPTDVGGDWIDCPMSTGWGNTTQTPGRLTAAGLSVAIPAGYAGGFMNYFDIAYDFHGVGKSIPPEFSFFSSINVGLISFADGFTQMSTTATQAMQCWAMWDHPRDADPEVLIAGEQISVSGHAAWHVQWHIFYNQGEPIPGEILDVIVIDMGPGADYFGLYLSCRPYDLPDFKASIQSAMASLRVG